LHRLVLLLHRAVVGFYVFYHPGRKNLCVGGAGAP
jgi:hypothetical protein